MMKMPPASAATKAAFEAIVKGLAEAGVESGAMFGMPAMKVGGKAFAGIFGDALVFKLSGDAHAAALALDGSTLFDPSGGGRAMKEWVVVPPAHRHQWRAFAEQSFGYVVGGQEKAKATGVRSPRSSKSTKKTTA